MNKVFTSSLKKLNLTTIFNIVFVRLAKYYRLFVKHDPYEIAIRQWFKCDGDSTLRLDYPLSERSIVFDVGGYRGEWAQQIAEKYNPHIFIFEPVLQFYDLILKKFKENPKVVVFNFGLLDKTQTAQLSINKDGSSIYKSNGPKTEISLVDIQEFLDRENAAQIDLIKINIEGAEYRLLERMLKTNIVTKCRNIQVQFHNFYPNAVTLRNEIRNSLNNTHYITYDFPFVWENWRRK